MTGVGAAAHVSRATLLLAVPTAVLGVSLAWQLAAPDVPQPSSLVRVLADCVGSVVLGLAALDRLQSAVKRKPITRERLWRPMAATAGVWLLAEVVLLVFAAADVDNSSVSGLATTHFADFLLHVNAGRVGAVAVICALAIVAYSAASYRRHAAWSTDPVLAVAALALTIRPITGHMSQQTLGPVLAAAHTLAAAVWFGVLTALALLVQTRGGWAEVLPRYSVWAWRCVVVLGVSGVINATIRIGEFGLLFGSGYGRIVVAKTVAFGLLIALGWWWRRTWVGEAANHRMTADGSLRRAVIEIVGMAVAFGLAATLATTS